MSEKPVSPTPAVRTFRAPNMLAALEAVQRELGSEALVLSARRLPGRFPWSLGRGGVEVVAMAPAVGNGSAPKAAVNGRPGRPPAADTKSDPSPPVPPSARVNGHARAALEQACAQLEAQGVDPGWVRKAATRCRASLPAAHLADAGRVRAHLAAQMLAAVRPRPTQALLAEERVVCLAGPRGSGKTSLLAKLAAEGRGEAAGPVLWVTADTFRAGALAEARVLAESLDLPLEVAYTPEDLSRVVDSAPKPARLLVDLPGFNPRAEAEVALVGEYLDVLADKTLYLVLPATAKPDAMVEAATALKPFGPLGLVVTRLDETGTYGNLFEVVRRTRLPLLWATSSAHVLDGLQPVEPRQLVRAILEGRWET